MTKIWESLKGLLQLSIPLGGEQSVGVLNLLGALGVLLAAYLLSRLRRGGRFGAGWRV